MEHLPKLIKPANYFERTSFNATSWKEIKELDELLYDCVEGSCCAILINNELIYNAYNKSRNIKQILVEDLLRHQFATNPHLILKPHTSLKIKVYMFFTNCWCFNINYEEGNYILSSFN